MVSSVITARRVTRVADVARHWKFFEEGIAYEAKYLRYAHPMETYRKILCHLVYDNPHGWIGIVFDDETPVAFIMTHDCTPMFSPHKEFEVSMFYYRPGYKHTIRLLQDRFDMFCKENGIGQYYLTTSSFCTRAKQVFNESWRGLERSNVVFKRKVL
jgi:hypothetical protein